MLKYNIYAQSPGEDIYVITYMNFFLAFLNNNEIDFAEEFARDYSKQLGAKFRKNTLSLAMVHVMMKRKEFEKAQNILSKVTKGIFYLTNSIHYLSIMAHYELSQFEEALYGIDAYEKYLRNNPEVSVDTQNRFLSFTKFIKKMASIRAWSIADAGELIHEIRNTTPIHNAEWLLEKAGELKG